jgi:hypothetical protein
MLKICFHLSKVSGMKNKSYFGGSLAVDILVDTSELIP